MIIISQRTLTIFVRVVALRYQHHTYTMYKYLTLYYHSVQISLKPYYCFEYFFQCCVVLITKGHNSHKHSSNLQTRLSLVYMNSEPPIRIQYILWPLTVHLDLLSLYQEMEVGSWFHLSFLKLAVSVLACRELPPLEQETSKSFVFHH